MRTVVVGERPPEVEKLLERRRAMGLDLFDEVWEGDYHVVPAPHRRHGEVDDQLARILGPRADRAGLRASGPCNVGAPDDYRVPDRAYFADRSPTTYNPSAEVIVEIVSPGDETWLKLDFYYRMGVKELLIVDPEARTAAWFARGDTGFSPVDRSAVLDLSAPELTELIDWPR